MFHLVVIILTSSPWLVDFASIKLSTDPSLPLSWTRQSRSASAERLSCWTVAKRGPPQNTRTNELTG